MFLISFWSWLELPYSDINKPSTPTNTVIIKYVSTCVNQAVCLCWGTLCNKSFAHGWLCAEQWWEHLPVYSLLVLWSRWSFVNQSSPPVPNSGAPASLKSVGLVVKVILHQSVITTSAWLWSTCWSIVCWSSGQGDPLSICHHHQCPTLQPQTQTFFHLYSLRVGIQN